MSRLLKELTQGTEFKASTATAAMDLLRVVGFDAKRYVAFNTQEVLSEAERKLAFDRLVKIAQEVEPQTPVSPSLGLPFAS